MQSEGIKKLKKRSDSIYAKVLIKMIDLWGMLGQHRYSFGRQKCAARTGKTMSMISKIIEMGMDTGILSNTHSEHYSFTRTKRQMQQELKELEVN